MRRFTIIISATILFCSFVSCSGRKKSSTEQNEATAVTDSLIIEVKQKEEKKALPDTTYISTTLIRYKVEQLDTLTDSKISDYDDIYNNTPGIFTFRGNMQRNADYGGRVNGRPDTIIVDWRYKTAMTAPDTTIIEWGGGSGWTGQPVYVHWPDSITTSLKDAGKANKDFTGYEIIIGSLCHMLYFIDLQTGKESRKAIDVGNPIKGSISLDPTLNGNLYVGQGVPSRKPFGHMIVDIEKGAISKFIPQDRKAQRSWGAFDSSPLRVDKFLFWPSENGTLYKYLCTDNGISLHSTLRYTRNGRAPGMEASISVYRNYGYTADNHGNIICTNLDTMHPVWCFDNGDDTDATIVVCEEDGTPYIYIGNEVDRKPEGPAYFRKLNAMTGELVWELALPALRANVGEKHFDGGYYASPLPGKGNCSGLIFSNCVANTDNQNGDFVAIKRSTGEVAYKIRLSHYAWSSPVGFTNENDEMFIFTGDTKGNVYLINGVNGKVICSKNVGINFESSPIVIGNQVVIGSRGNSIYKMSIR